MAQIRIPIIADDARFAATLAAYEARVRALNAQLGAMHLQPVVGTMQPVPRRAVIVAPPRGATPSPAQTARADSPHVMTGLGLGVAAAAAIGTMQPGRGQSFRSSPLAQKFRDQYVADMAPINEYVAKDKTLSRADRRDIQKSDDFMRRSQWKAARLEMVRKNAKLGPSRGRPFSIALRARLEPRYANHFENILLDEVPGVGLERKTVHRHNRMFGTNRTLKTAWRSGFSVENMRRAGAIGPAAVNTYRRINRGARMLGGGATAMSIGSLVPMAVKAAEVREQLVHSGKYTPGATVWGATKLVVPEIAGLMVQSGALAMELLDLATFIPGSKMLSPFHVIERALGTTSEVRAFGVSEFLRRLRGEQGYNQARSSARREAREIALDQSATMALRALEVGFSSGSGNDIREAYFNQIRPFAMRDAEQRFTEQMTGRKQ